MKIMVFEGSPNKRGSSNLLTTEFIHGAKAAGHLVQTVDAAHAEIHPCTGCIHCGYEGPCVQKDEMNRIREMILDADMRYWLLRAMMIIGHLRQWEWCLAQAAERPR